MRQVILMTTQLLELGALARRGSRRARGVARVLVLAGAAIGCEQASPAASGGQAVAPLRPPTWGSTDCGLCVLGHCEARQVTCDADPSCAAFLSCLLACPVANGALDADCERACSRAATADGEVARGAFEACRRAYTLSGDCEACRSGLPPEVEPEEGGPPGGTHPLLAQSCAPSTNPDVCARCIESHCCDSWEGCWGDCDDYESCSGGCKDDAACDIDCIDEHPGGVKPMSELTACAHFHCKLESPLCGHDLKPCERCMLERCSDRYINCSTDPDCRKSMVCMSACQDGDGGCAEACFYGKGRLDSPVWLFSDCFFVACKDACPAR